MRLLLDSCVWGPAREALRGGGHDVDWVGEWQGDPGDEAILEAAREAQRILVTLDSDFGNLAIFRRLPHSGIIRLVGIHPRQQAMRCEQVLLEYGAELIAGAIITADQTRIRVRPAKPD